MAIARPVRLKDGAVVGLPRALLYYELYPFWRGLLEALGLRVAVSPATSRQVIEAGTSQAMDEACLPVKSFYGHVLVLRDRVDAVFLPRLVSLSPGTYTCPKMLGLPDMVRQNLRGLPPAIVADFDSRLRRRSLEEGGEDLACRLGRSRRHAREAVSKGLEALRNFRGGLEAGLSFEEAASGAEPGWKTPLKGWKMPVEGRREPVPAGDDLARARPDFRPLRVGLVGHAYNLFDPGVNLGLDRKLALLGCDLVTSEQLSEEEVRTESAARTKEIFWSSGRRILAAVTRFRRRGLVDGLIHVVSFGCGPDSMVGEIAERETRRSSNLPYMALTIDEHTAEAGLLTRVEAFVDMLARRRARPQTPEGAVAAEVTA
jgi:predicted nucleotide-binding protein (sugar kinase/HSP70/actin superfamily)